MTRRLLACVCVLAAAVAALPAVAAARGRKAKRPTVTLVSPMRARVGDTITIRGRNFSRTARKNTVLLAGPNGRSAFAKPIKASARRLTVVVPATVAGLFTTGSAGAVPTRFKLKVLANGRTSRAIGRLSPVIVPPASPSPGRPVSGGPAPSGGTGASTGTAPSQPCGTGDDWDGDLLTNDFEVNVLKTDPCKKDTDGDGVDDGYEYRSAVDLNDDEFQQPNNSLPYPGKRPYPNPLDGTDANTDFDGDSLTLAEEFTLWNYTIQKGAVRDLNQLTYSDGEQYSMYVRGSNGRRMPTLAASGYDKQQGFLGWASANGYRQVMLQDGAPWYAGSSQNLYGLLDFNRDGSEAGSAPGYWRTETTYYDLNGDGWLSDDERDEDGDGLTNYDETHGRMTPTYWNSCYKQEGPFQVQYTGTNYLDPDTDGDGIVDGADDQDHDDIPNVMELSRNAASGLDDSQGFCKPKEGLPTPPDTNHPDAYGRVNPFNPCLPASWSRTCPQHPAFGGGTGAPFDDSPNWYALN